jgi:hypothetical protein
MIYFLKEEKEEEKEEAYDRGLNQRICTEN